MHMEHIKHRHICWALPPPDRIAWPCERLPFWYMPKWLWRQDTRLIMFVCHTQRSPGSLNWWRVTWDQRLQVCTTSPVNVVGSALARLSIYWDQGERASQAYPPWTTWQASSDDGQIQPWTWMPTTTPNSCLSNPDTWTILSGQHKRPSSILTTATHKLSFLNRSPKPLIHSLKEGRCSPEQLQLASAQHPLPGPHISVFSSSLITSTVSPNSNSTSSQTAPKLLLWIPSSNNEGRPI